MSGATPGAAVTGPPSAALAWTPLKAGRPGFGSAGRRVVGGLGHSSSQDVDDCGEQVPRGLGVVVVLVGHAWHAGQVGGHGVGVDGPAQGESLGQGGERDGEVPGGERGPEPAPVERDDLLVQGDEVVLAYLALWTVMLGSRIMFAYTLPARTRCRQGRSCSGPPVALRDIRWPRPSREILAVLLPVIPKQEHWLCRAEQGVLVPVRQTGEGGRALGC
jgi:hypothetical protein